jgi:hypothetical protein
MSARSGTNSSARSSFRRAKREKQSGGRVAASAVAEKWLRRQVESHEASLASTWVIHSLERHEFTSNSATRSAKFAVT